MKGVVYIIFVLVLSACSTDKDLIEQGKVLFNKPHLGENKVAGCVMCHSIKPTEKTAGPNLFGLKQRSESLIPHTSAKEYIKQSIINPDAYLVEGYLPGVMFSHYAQELSETEIDSLVAYLLEL